MPIDRSPADNDLTTETERSSENFACRLLDRELKGQPLELGSASCRLTRGYGLQHQEIAQSLRLDATPLFIVGSQEPLPFSGASVFHTAGWRRGLPMASELHHRQGGRHLEQMGQRCFGVYHLVRNFELAQPLPHKIRCCCVASLAVRFSVFNAFDSPIRPVRRIRNNAFDNNPDKRSTMRITGPHGIGNNQFESSAGDRRAFKCRLLRFSANHFAPVIVGNRFATAKIDLVDGFKT